MLLLKKWWNISSAWCRQHWRWLILFSVFVVVYFLGKNKGRVELIQAKLALKQYKQEKEAIEAAHNKETELREKARSKYKEAMSLINERFHGQISSTEIQKEQNIRALLKESKSNPDKIDNILEKELGIKKQ